MSTLSELKNKFYHMSGYITRDGMKSLTDWLETTDFFVAPASTKFHGNYEGGLVEHSIHVAEYAMSIFNLTVKARPELEYLRQSVLFAALFHDVCKVNQYSKEECWAKDENNKWYKYLGWKFTDEYPIGHGEKSLMYIAKHVDLNAQEAMAIRWHMGTTEPGTQITGMTQFSYNQAFENPLVKIIIAADIASTCVGETLDLKSVKLS